MTLHDATTRIVSWLRRWWGALAAGAPEGMAHVVTENLGEERVVDPIVARRLLEPYRCLLDDDRHRAPVYQVPGDGIGSLYHREYRIVFETEQTAESIVLALARDLNRFTHPALARFEKSRGDSRRFDVGDRFDIIITGPWNGPVEVVDSRPGQFSFITLRGHLEAGFITFRATAVDAGRVEFAIQSWATCSDILVWFSYAVLGISKHMQTRMWRFFCLSVAQEFGRDCSSLSVRTYRIRSGSA